MFHRNIFVFVLAQKFVLKNKFKKAINYSGNQEHGSQPKIFQSQIKKRQLKILARKVLVILGTILKAKNPTDRFCIEVFNFFTFAHTIFSTVGQTQLLLYFSVHLTKAEEKKLLLVSIVCKFEACYKRMYNKEFIIVS